MILPEADEPLIEINRVDPRIAVDLRYATANNFARRVLYPEGFRCLARRGVVERLSRVQSALAAEGLGLKVLDAFRPLSVQRALWEAFPDPRYVANPARGSRHNRGTAVDVTLVDADGHEVAMPSAFDEFGEVAHRGYAGGDPQRRAKRDLLGRHMEAEGFVGLEEEWWHFDLAGWERYPLVESI